MGACQRKKKIISRLLFSELGSRAVIASILVKAETKEKECMLSWGMVLERTEILDQELPGRYDGLLIANLGLAVLESLLGGGVKQPNAVMV